MKQSLPNNSWSPLASLTSLQQRAGMVQQIRNFFLQRNVLEISTPLLANSTITDPNIASLQLANDAYLQTSPEFHMKRLVAAYECDIYQITKAFRDDEHGNLHNREFTILEWYRLGFSYQDLMDEVEELLTMLINKPVFKQSYQELFQEYLQVDVTNLSLLKCQQLADNHNLHIVATDLTVMQYLDLFMSSLIEPQLPRGVYFIYDFLPPQAALAKINAAGFAERFEVYVDGIEIANGFSELTCAYEQQQRFITDNKIRDQRGLPTIPLDHNFLAALDFLPECSGVAIGLDRLIMVAISANSLDQILSFR